MQWERWRERERDRKEREKRSERERERLCSRAGRQSHSDEATRAQTDHLCCSCGFSILSCRPLCRNTSQTCLRAREDGEQHVTGLHATVDSMLRLHHTSAACFWCFLLITLQRWALADEEAHWGTTPSEKPPEDQHSSYWWPPSLPKIPSLSLPRLHIPFSLWGQDEVDVLTTTASVVTEPIDRSQDHWDSSEASVPPTTLTTKTKIRTEPPPAGTPDSPYRSTAHGHNDALVSDSYSLTSSSIPSTLFASNPASTNAPEQNATCTHPPQRTAQAVGPSMGATEQHLSKEHTDRDPTNRISAASSTLAPETTVPTALTQAAAQIITTNPGPLDTTLTRHPLGSTTSPRSPETTYVTTPQDATVNLTPGKTATAETQPLQGEADLSFSESTSGPAEEQSTAMAIDRKLVLESITTTSLSQEVNVPITGDIPLNSDEWLVSPKDNEEVTFLPDCNKERSGICNISDTWDLPTSDVKPTQNTTATNMFMIPAPPMLVPLYSDWNSAMAAWGLAWEAHVYGTGCAFAMLTLASALNLLCLPLRCPSGCGYFALVSLFLLAAGCTRSFSLLYDAYGHQDRLPSTEASLMLYEAPFPCLTAAFGLVFLLLSMRSRMQLSYSAFQRPCFLACLVVLHFAAAFGPVTLLRFYQQKPLCLFLSLISRGAFVALATFLSAAYFVFYIYVRADSKHIYHLNNTSPTPAERYNRCPFAESRDWERAALTVCLSALFFLACAGLQLYAMLNAMGVAGGEEVFHPWPWWTFQFSCRLCELGVCLTLAFVVAQPVYCSNHLSGAGSCWTELLASKSPMIPGSYQWTLSQQEKLAIVDTIGLGETESLPLYTLIDDRLANSLNDLDLLYHSNRALAYQDLDLHLQDSEKPEGGAPSGGSSITSDSTADLRPPSPINLRRSIDEALFSEALFPMSLFSTSGTFRCSDQSINNGPVLQSSFCDPFTDDSGLYRTSSCVEMASQPHLLCTQSQADTDMGGPSPSLSCSSSCSSPEQWRDSSSCSLYRASLGGSSHVLCPSPDTHTQQANSGNVASSGQQAHPDPQKCYHALGATSQQSLDLDMSSEADRSVQQEFICVCKQTDALSICSETIDL
ncbi:proline-rich transmembrane protein 4 isoform X2 [Thalassophryne amazonica]|uniref:proline-rich transmembrane protein 4 isoform X2 n=1 Tax=Thalassophryne amazonica TaxID=390379 RepID=UPI001472685C|nr:proline-rich transmembrane protein 4 isoform X2 [Thalassophryne amazonica]